jgi:hypothetical protein
MKRSKKITIRIIKIRIINFLRRDIVQDILPWIFLVLTLYFFMKASQGDGEELNKMPKADKTSLQNSYTKSHNIYLGQLEKLDCVIWWEIQKDTLKIWTAEDERNAELERYNYIRSLDSTGWE